jgi:pyridoxal 5'-phosphate synthase pdxT subunit
VGAAVGVLALQGDFALHVRSLRRLGAEARIVRSPAELEPCKGLILPGGESTTFVNLLRKTGMFDAVREFSKQRALMGTCAGLITLASSVVGSTLETLDLIDLSVERNAYGRQVNSFIGPVALSWARDLPEFEGVFIRAPKIRSLGKDVEALGRCGDEIVLARNKRVLAMTFHPELTDDTRIHEYFLREMAEKTVRQKKNI